MVDSQARLNLGNGEPIARGVGLLVISAVVVLVLLRKLNVSASVSN